MIYRKKLSKEDAQNQSLNVALIFASAFFLIALTILVLMIIARVKYNCYWISGASMQPTLFSEDIVPTIDTSDQTIINVGDIVTIKNPTGDNGLIKRIVALPNDTIQIKDGILYVNGEKSYYNKEIMLFGLEDEYTHRLKDDEYFYLGDNRNVSMDSREFGPCKFEDIDHIVLDYKLFDSKSFKFFCPIKDYKS